MDPGGTAAQTTALRKKRAQVNFRRKNVRALQPLESTLARNRAHEAMVLGTSCDGNDGLYQVPHTARGTVLPLITASRAGLNAQAQALQASLSATLSAQAAAHTARASEQSLCYLDHLATVVNLEDAFADHRMHFNQVESEEDDAAAAAAGAGAAGCVRNAAGEWLHVDTNDDDGDDGAADGDGGDEGCGHTASGSPQKATPLPQAHPMHGIFKWQRQNKERYLDEGPGARVAGTWMYPQQDCR
jgi:hypothetical protein